VRTDRLKRDYGIELRWTVFPLHPEIPEEGTELSELFRGRNFEIESMQQRLREVAEALGLPLVPRTSISNSRWAQELGKWAESMGKGDQFRRCMYHAYFAEGRNIALLPELETISESAGLPRDEVYDILAQSLFAEAVDADWARARELAVTAVPFHLFGEKTLVGFHPYEDFEEFLGQKSP
jgi:predicted DsbA family dithiol-disulfide isomerase